MRNFGKVVFVLQRNIRLLYGIALLQGMVFYGPIATLYRQAHGLGLLEISVIETISLVLGLVLEVPWGAAADRIGYRRTMVLCCWLYFVSKLVFWRADGFGGFLAERVLLSVVTAGLSGVDESILYLSCPPEARQRTFGVYGSMQMAGLLIASAVFSLGIREDYAGAALLTAGSYALAALLSLGLREVRVAEAPSEREGFGQTLRLTLHDGRLLLFLVGAALLTEVHQTVTVFLSQPQYARCGLDDAAMGGLYIAATLLGLLGRWSAAVTERMGLRRALLAFSAAPALACTALAWGDAAGVAAAGILTLRLSNVWFQPLRMTLQNRMIRSRNRATALSVQAMLQGAVGAGVSLLLGALGQRSLPLAFWAAAGLCAGALALLRCSRR